MSGGECYLSYLNLLSSPVSRSPFRFFESAVEIVYIHGATENQMTVAVFRA